VPQVEGYAAFDRLTVPGGASRLLAEFGKGQTEFG